jgi:hypothetical protein
MAEQTPRTSFCPFWSPLSMKCSLCSEGLFIPLDDHIDVYCKTEDYPMCLQYSLSHESFRKIAGYCGPTLSDNRRNYERIESTHPLTLVRLSSSGKVASHFTSPASTIDLSMGGLRLRMQDPLINDTVVRFSFDDSVPELLQSGTATIKWCYRMIDTSEYQAGLAFRSNQTVEAMGMYLGIHNRQR